MDPDKQKVKEYSISRLVLWSENPRDPLPDRKSGRENDKIIRRAIADEDGSWKLSSLLNQMGGAYDFSEIPTVVVKGGSPIVYDGNRRVILAIIRHTPKYLKLLPSSMRKKLASFEVPNRLYCNVCPELQALDFIVRKHSQSGSWKPIQQGRFRMMYSDRKKDKDIFPSALLQLNALTDGAIEKSNLLNQGFVETQVFKKGHLESLNISVEEDCIKSPYTKEELRAILTDIFEKIEDDTINTRKRPRVGELPSLLSADVQALCSSRKDQPRVYTEKYTPVDPAPIEEERPINNLYREIEALDKLITKNVGKGLSEDAHIVIRMALRLLCETAWKDLKMNYLEEYLKKYFDVAKARLCKAEKTLLSKNLSDEDPKPLETHKQLLSWLQDSAHTYDESTRNYRQTIAMSVLVGAILSCSHGKE